MTNFNERTNTLLYKNISLTLYSRKGWCFLCVRGEWREGQTVILTQVLLTITAPFSHFGWFAQPWVTESPKPSICAGFHSGILSPTDSNRPGTWLYYYLSSTCFRCSSAYIHRCISWLTGLLEGQYITFVQ